MPSIECPRGQGFGRRAAILGCVWGLLLAATGCATLGPGDEHANTSYAAAGEGTAAGIPYVERETGGAGAEDRLPMIVAIHPRGGSIEQFEHMFASFPARARLIIPHGHAAGAGRYRWWDVSVRRDTPETMSEAVRPVEEQLAAAIQEWQSKRPTVGRVVVCGFSQGAMLSFALVAKHPDLIGAAFPFSGYLPVGMSPGVWRSAAHPYVHAFHGVNDNAIRIDSARSSIEEFRRLGLTAQITEYPELGHELGASEVQAALTEMASLVSRPGGP